MFMTLLCPILLVGSLFCVGPIRMARIGVAFSSGLVCFWSVAFFIRMLSFRYDMYAIFWDALGPDNVPCICLCQYPFSLTVFGRIVVLNLAVILGSFFLAFRALKGLRQAQWASLFSVLYVVPIEAFPVTWEAAGGGPIRHRRAEEDVQGEPAFDPFCLMDEQPESGHTTVRLFPVQQSTEQAKRWTPLAAPLEERIGCCGFPVQRGWAQQGVGGNVSHDVGPIAAVGGEPDAEPGSSDVLSIEDIQMGPPILTCCPHPQARAVGRGWRSSCTDWFPFRVRLG